MKYNVTFKISSPDKTESKIIKAVFEIDKSGDFEYGNGRVMSVMYLGDYTCWNHYDIRYDSRYSSDNEPAYIKKFLKSWYTGKYGSWRATGIKVVEAK